jgi:hypothetical protein
MSASTIDPTEWAAAFKIGNQEIFLRLLEQALETKTKMPVTSYAEAMDCFTRVATFPRLAAGPEQSARTCEALMPFFIELYHLVFVLAEEGDDPNKDTMAVVDSLGFES